MPTSTSHEESESIKLFRIWFSRNGGRIHQDLYFTTDSSGITVRTRRALQSEVAVLSCPFSLAINLENIEESLESFGHLTPEQQISLSPRQRICAYIGLHFIIPETEDEKCLLRHRPYINILPKAENMFTPLYFSETELEIFKGTNLFGATADQRNTWMNEYRHLLDVLAERCPLDLSEKFTFEMYQLAATYLSSRAFPSTLLSHKPSLNASPLSYPVLLPGLDLCNHKRGQPVSWSISCADSLGFLTTYSAVESNFRESDLCVSLAINTRIVEDEEVFNNYGPKPNSSLILGYGFALPDNPDDTIMLKIGSTSDDTGKGASAGYEMGRNASGAEAVWNDVQRIVAAGYSEDIQPGNAPEMDAAVEIQIDVETTDTLIGMVSSLIVRLPDLTAEHAPPLVRGEVRSMWRCYVQGQKDILEAFLNWLERKERGVVRKAEGLGVNIVGEDSEDE